MTFPISGLLHLDGWHGRSKEAVTVIGETPKRYRITAEQKVTLAGRCRVLLPGNSVLVPKYAISFPHDAGEHTP